MRNLHLSLALAFAVAGCVAGPGDASFEKLDEASGESCACSPDETGCVHSYLYGTVQRPEGGATEDLPIEFQMDCGAVGSSTIDGTGTYSVVVYAFENAADGSPLDSHGVFFLQYERQDLFYRARAFPNDEVRYDLDIVRGEGGLLSLE